MPAGNQIPHVSPGAALVISVTSNLGLLGYFKYFNFGADAYRALLLQLGWSQPVPDALWQVILPLGISFYTFQSLSYTIDIYRGEARPARSFLDFACYVSLFPQLVAGSIIRFQDLADQLSILLSRIPGRSFPAVSCYSSWGWRRKLS